LTRLKGDYRWNIVVKAPKSVDPSGRRLHELIRTSVDKYEGSKLRKKKSVRVIVDIDPVGMM
jgi:primosomal protein N'